MCKCFKPLNFKVEDNDPIWLKIAFGELGIHEIKGAKHNERIIEYHKTCSLKAKDDETSWCSAFVNWCIIGSNIKGTNKANARSWLKWGKKSEGFRGDVCVLWRESVSSWKGHVGFLLEKTDKHVYLLGGNQGDKVSIKKYNINRVLEYRNILA